MNNAIIDLIDSLNAHKSSEDLFQSCQAFFTRLDVRHVNIGFIQMESLDVIGLFSNMSEEWLARYTEANYASIDPYALRSIEMEGTAVLSHNNVLSSLGDLTPSQRKMMHEVQEEGFISSVLHSGTSKTSGIKTVVNLTTDLDAEKMQRFVASREQELLIGGALSQLAFMNFSEAHLSGKSFYPIAKKEHRLTQREAEVVKWLATGRRNDWIADRLLISTSTVNFHIISAKRKLGAKTREQLVASAILKNLIEL